MCFLFHKYLIYRQLESASQKWHFWLLKVALLDAERGTFASQKFPFWKAKVQVVYLYAFRV